MRCRRRGERITYKIRQFALFLVKPFQICDDLKSKFKIRKVYMFKLVLPFLSYKKLIDDVLICNRHGIPLSNDTIRDSIVQGVPELRRNT